MFIALLTTKTNEIAINCATFNEAWATLNKLAENAETTVLAGEVLREWAGIDGFSARVSIASMRTIR